MKRYVLYSEEWGVYLGSFLGLGFWSGLDPAGQDVACVFSSASYALSFAEAWESHSPTLQAVPVECASGAFATVAECVAAGLPGWTP